MDRKSHIYIGEYVLRTYLPGVTSAQRSAFMLGCVYPDRNPFTYLKGSVHHRSFRGHNWENAANCIQKLCRRVVGAEELSLQSIYSLGLALHYICDAFTYAHNRSFRLGLRYHRSYEAYLHRRLESADCPAQESFAGTDLWRYILDTHSRYRSSPCGAATDCAFIWEAVHQTCGVFCRSLALNGSAPYKFTKKFGEFCPTYTCKTE